MFPTRVLCAKKNLLLCFDAFGTLYRPNIPIYTAYAQAAVRHGVKCEGKNIEALVGNQFKSAFQEASTKNPNYGKATGLGPEKWWRNVIHSTFQHWLEPGQQVPQTLVDELYTRYSSETGYDLFQDVKPFFQKLRDKPSADVSASWPWEKTVVGIISNSDDRVPHILASFGLKVSPRRVGVPDQRPAEAALEDDVSFVVLSYDVGVAKPEQGIYDAAVESLEAVLASRDDGLKVDDFEKLYIGDVLKDDYYGAKKAGWDALLLDRKELYRGLFAKKGRGISSTVIKAGSVKTFWRPIVLKNLEALSEWSPPRRTPTSVRSEDVR